MIGENMGFPVTDRWSGMDNDVSIEHMKKLFESLDIDDDEHPDISLTHDSEWGLSVFRGGGLLRRRSQ
jgi:hypothetical protein